MNTNTTMGGTVTRRVWTLPADGEKPARDAVEKTNKTLRRNGLAPYAVEVAQAAPVPEFDDDDRREANGHTEIDGVPWPTRDGVPLPVKCWHERITFTVVGDVPRMTGPDGRVWEFVAVLENDEHAGTLTRCVPGVDVDLSALRARGATECDHCRTDRYRRKVYAVRETGTDHLLQVGSTCLSLFVGVTVSLPDAAFGLDGLDQRLTSLGEGGFGDGGAIAFTSVDVLAVTAHLVDSHGWVSRSRVDEYGGISTASRVMAVLYPPTRSWEAREASRRVWAALTDDDRKRGAAVLEYARTVPQDSEYHRNIAAVAQGERVSSSNVGLLASAVVGYNRHVERIVAERRQANSAHQGEVGQKWLFRALTVSRADPQKGDYGLTYKVKMVDPDGNVVEWSASSFGARPGDVLDVTGSVKAHEITIWRGTRVTGTPTPANDTDDDVPAGELYAGLTVRSVYLSYTSGNAVWWVRTTDRQGRPVTWKATENPNCREGNVITVRAAGVGRTTRITRATYVDAAYGPALPHSPVNAARTSRKATTRKPGSSTPATPREPATAPTAPSVTVPSVVPVVPASDEPSAEALAWEALEALTLG